MTWTPTPPSTPGRYWWRAPDKYERHENRQYGILLVAWSHNMKEYAPDLRIRMVCSFNSAYGGELHDGQSWSYGSGYKLDEVSKSYPGIEFWSEPERGPEGFLPELPGKPDWTPPDPKVVEAAKKAAIAKAKMKQEEEEDERAEKIREARESGEKLYVCTQCDELIGEDEVVQIRECPHCNDEAFNGTEEGQNCPSCNRKFTRNVTETGCADCLVECEEFEPDPAEEPSPAPPAPSVPESKKKRSRK